MNISDMLIVSDLDGTLVPEMAGISLENLDAIARFREKGGSFTVATGRSPASARPYIDLLEVHQGIICNNGAVVYHVDWGRHTWYQPLPPIFRQIVREVQAYDPMVAIEGINVRDEYYLVASNEELENIVTVHGLTAFHCSAQELPVDCCKVLFAIRLEDFDRVADWIRARGYPGVEFVASGGNCFEMLPEGINKGYPLEELAKTYGKSLKNTIAVGDYYNDAEMLCRAGIGVAMGNAPEAVKSAADRVTGRCEDNGVAELIDWLMTHCGEL